MRNLNIILFLIITCIKSLNAVEKNENALDSMLQQNFKLFLIEDRRSDSIRIANLNKANKNEDPLIFKYINDTYFSIDSYPSGFEFKDTINGMKVSYIDLMDYMSLKQTLRKPKYIMSLYLIKIEKNDIYFIYILSNTSLKNKYEFNQIFHKWFNCHYRYDCDLKRWILIESK